MVMRFADRPMSTGIDQHNNLEVRDMVSGSLVKTAITRWFEPVPKLG
ncbi:MAG: hypothetical protein LBF60_07445 [Treponema sp.]|jgi:hypothetical protein|nr:hypothetical protein [Treponema sp.]